MQTITLKVNGVDKTAAIDPLSFSRNAGLTNVVDTCQFIVRRTDPSQWKPDVLDTIEVKASDGSWLFAGKLVTIEEVLVQGIEEVRCNCRDWSFDMDRYLIVGTFDSYTVNDIIAFMVTSQLGAAGFTMTNVNCPVVVGHVSFNYEAPSKCLQQLAQLVSYDWYVDEDKDIHFFPSMTELAPFNLDDTSGNYYVDSLVVKKDATKIKNVITVRGGQYLDATVTEKIVADGQQLIFNLGHKFDAASMSVTVNGVAKLLGIENTDDLNVLDCVSNVGNKYIRFKPSTQPTAGQVVAVSGLPYKPVLTRKQRNASVLKYGPFHYRIQDNSIITKETSYARAEAELKKEAEIVDDGSFVTKRNGLKVGHVLTISSDMRGIAITAQITRIVTTMRGPDGLRHQVTFAQTETTGMVELLQTMLMAQTKGEAIASNEMLDEFLSAEDSAEMSDSVGAASTLTGPYYYA